MAAELRFRAMGTDVHLLVVGVAGGGLVEGACERIEDLERRWSRFLPDTELVAVNAAAGTGEPTELSAATFELVELALDWWQRGGGLFDPTVLPALVAAGYGRSFELGPSASPALRAGADTSSRGGKGVMLDPQRRTVTLDAGVALDLGGIGKGAAADIVSDELAGATGVVGGCVNLGGDLRVWGTSPDGGDGWSVAIDDPFAPSTVAHVIGLASGAVATSTTAKRFWTTADGTFAHHLIDPRTGRPAETDVVQVTVIAAEATTAEVLAKVALLAGSEEGVAVLRRHGVAACVTRTDGSSDDVGDYEAYRW